MHTYVCTYADVICAPYICVYTYVYIYIRIHTYTFVYIKTHTLTHTTNTWFVHICVHTQPYLRVVLEVFGAAEALSYIHAILQLPYPTTFDLYVCKCTCSYNYTHTHTHSYTYIYIYVWNRRNTLIYPWDSSTILSCNRRYVYDMYKWKYMNLYMCIYICTHT